MLILQQLLICWHYQVRCGYLVSILKVNCVIPLENAPDLWQLSHHFVDMLMPLRYHPNPEVTDIVLVGFIAVGSSLNPQAHTEFLSYIQPIHDWLTGNR